MQRTRTIFCLRCISLMAVINLVVPEALTATARAPGALAPATEILPASREYKLLVSPDALPGAVFKDGRLTDGPRGLKEYWQKLRQQVPAIKERDFSKPTKVRKIVFFDTKAADLCTRHFLLRLHTQTKNDKSDLTYNFRHPERFVAAAIGLNAVKGGAGEVELGEKSGCSMRRGARSRVASPPIIS